MISVAYAQAATDAATAATAAATHAEPFYANPAFWVGVSFVLVVGFAFKPLMAAVGAALDTRAAKIKARLDEATRLREEAQEMLATYQRKQRDAMREAEEIIAHAKAEAERLSQQAARDLEAQLKRREEQAMERIAQAEAQAMREVKNLAVDVAVAAARNVMGHDMSASQSGSLLEKSIADLPQKLH